MTYFYPVKVCEYYFIKEKEYNKYFVVGAKDWLGINTCAAFVSTQTSQARFRLLIVEPDIVSQCNVSNPSFTSTKISNKKYRIKRSFLFNLVVLGEQFSNRYY